MGKVALLRAISNTASSSIIGFCRNTTIHRCYSTVASDTPTYSIHTFESDYPIVLNEDATFRESRFNKQTRSHVSWLEKVVFSRIERNVSSFLAKAWVNGKIIASGIDPSSQDKDSASLNPLLALRSDQFTALSEYLPDKFIAGAEPSLQAFLEAIPKDSLHSSASSLSLMCKPKLFKEFEFHHDQLRSLGITLQLQINYIKNLDMDQVWLAFGSNADLKSTLDSGEIVQSFSPTHFISQKPNSSTVTIRKGAFSYAMGVDELVHVQDQNGSNSTKKYSSPTPAKLNSVMGRGFMIGIDVFANVNMTLSMHKAPIKLEESDESQVEDKEDVDRTDDLPLWSRAIEREMIFRFETDHAKGAFHHSWKIADVDNLLASEWV
ncbi:hypothetical protein RTP6_003131 [Batrachochytrium dendrobatidis]